MSQPQSSTRSGARRGLLRLLRNFYSAKGSTTSKDLVWYLLTHRLEKYPQRLEQGPLPSSWKGLCKEEAKLLPGAAQNRRWLCRDACGKGHPWEGLAPARPREWEACPQWEAALTGFPALTTEHCSEQTWMLYMNVNLNLWFLHPPHFLELTFSGTFGLFISRLLFCWGFSFVHFIEN